MCACVLFARMYSCVYTGSTRCEERFTFTTGKCVEVHSLHASCRAVCLALNFTRTDFFSFFFFVTKTPSDRTFAVVFLPIARLLRDRSRRGEDFEVVDQRENYAIRTRASRAKANSFADYIAMIESAMNGHVYRQGSQFSLFLCR